MLSIFDLIILSRKDSQEEAKSWADKHRARYPALYNVIRLIEQPRPIELLVENAVEQQLPPVDESTNSDTESDDAIEPPAELHENDPEDANNVDERNEVAGPQLPPVEEPANNDNGTNDAVEPHLPADIVDDIGALARDATLQVSMENLLIDDDWNIDDIIELSSDDEAEAAGGSNEVDEKPDIKCTADAPQPIACKLEFDRFSGIIPFALNVSILIIIIIKTVHFN